MNDKPQLLLEHHLKKLKLPAMLRDYQKIAGICAAEKVEHTGFLLRLAELELIEREQRSTMRRIKAAGFAAIKSLDSFDFKAIPSLNKMLVLDLARCEYITKRQNLLLVGNSGTGKTHLALALGLAACQKGFKVRFTTRVYKQVCNWLSYDLSSRRLRWPGRRAKQIPSWTSC
jgi:DNA replication protein DnaC